jgi:hypothetical protein
VDEARFRELGVRLPDGLLSSRKGANGRAIQPNANEDRDRYIYEQYRQGAPLKVIVAEVNDNPNWEHFNNDDPRLRTDAVLKAKDRYCKRHGLEVPVRKSRDRRRNST